MLNAIIKVFIRFPLYNVVMFTDKGNHNAVTPFVFIGNNRYETGSLKSLGQRTSLSRGVLSMYYPRCASRLCMIKIIVKALIN
jgi:hypothetical protein